MQRYLEADPGSLTVGGCPGTGCRIGLQVISVARMDRFADAIRKIGPEFCILSSDLGQRGNALPPDGFAEFLIAMRNRGFTDQEINMMSKRNPARLLGLE